MDIYTLRNYLHNAALNVRLFNCLENVHRQMCHSILLTSFCQNISNSHRDVTK